MATYSINTGTTTETTFLGNLDPNLMLDKIPNNTGQLIVPEDVRDAIYTQWENTIFKQVSITASTVEYIGIGGSSSLSNYTGSEGLKILIGKPLLSGVNTMSKKLVEYLSGDSTYPDGDIILYNFKPDSYGNANQQFTKVQFLAGDNSNDLFLTAPYMLSQQNVGGTAIDFTIFNETGKITIDSDDELVIGSPNTRITLLYGTGSTGIATLPGGNPGDIQYNIDDCEFGGINGGSASLGDVLIMGATNSAYWGSLAINSVFTLNQVLTAGNQTAGTDILLSLNDDSLYMGGTGSTTSRFYYDGTQSIISATTGILKIDVETLRIELPSIGNNLYLQTDGSGNAIWGTVSSSVPGGSDTNIQYNNSSAFTGTNLLRWDYTYTGMLINSPTVVSGTYSMNVKSNGDGGIFLDTNQSEFGLHITDGTNSVVKIDTSSNKSLEFDQSNGYDFIFGGDYSESRGKYTLINGTPSRHIVLVDNIGEDEYRISYETVSNDARSTIAFSPKNNRGMFLGVSNNVPDALYIGNHTGDLNDEYKGSIVVYPQGSGSGTFSSLLANSDSGGQSVVIGNSDKGTQSYGDMVSTDNRRVFGINITPAVDMHLYGVEAIVPESKSLESYGGSYWRINDITTSYIMLNDATDANGLLHRIGGATGSQVTTFGTTLRIWNMTGNIINIHHISTELPSYNGAGYSADSMKNIYLSQMGLNNPDNGSPYTWENETEMTFVYLPQNSNMDYGGLEPLEFENGVWYGQSYETYDSIL